MRRLDVLRTLAVAAGLLVASSAIGAERTHTVRGGESASSIAKRYYGNYEIADLLLRYNGRSSTVIRAGEKLRVPLCEIHRVRAGDSWSAIAQRYLGRPSAYREIAALNGIAPESPLRIGDAIVIPVILRHSLKRGESLVVLAERFYGDAGLSRVLQTFNRIDDPRGLAVGQTVQIPLTSFRPRESAGEVSPPAVARAGQADRSTSAPAPAKPARKQAEPTPKPTKPATRTEPQAQDAGRSRLAVELHTASRAFAEGDYERARSLLESLRDGPASEGTAAERAEMWRLLAFVYVAFDLPDEACAAHNALERSTSETKLDPDLVSPKIRQALARCADREG
jgi:LysM repeat protein